MILMTEENNQRASAEFDDTPPFDSDEADGGEDADQQPDAEDVDGEGGV